MCGRYVSPDTAAIERQWQLQRSVTTPFAARFNVAPASEVPVLFNEEKALSLATGRWGLIPHWWKEAKPPRHGHNARIEEAAGKPLWRDAMRGSRCLVPALGWYEWRDSDKQPFYFFRRDGRLGAFAGLYCVHEHPGTGVKVLTCALLTTQAQGPLAGAHDRMPLVLPDAAQQPWLERGETAVAAHEIAYYPVRRLVNAARAEGPELIEALQA